MPSDTDAQARKLVQASEAALEPFTTPTTGGSEGTSEQVAEGTTDKPRLFGGLTAQEAGRRSAQARREKERQGETDAAQERKSETIIVRTTVATGKVIQKLSDDAGKGNVQAARELRGWLSELPVETDTDLTTLDKRTRQALLARLLNEVEAEDALHGLHEHEGDEAGQSTSGEAEAAPIATLHVREEGQATEGATPPKRGTPVRAPA